MYSALSFSQSLVETELKNQLITGKYDTSKIDDLEVDLNEENLKSTWYTLWKLKTDKTFNIKIEDLEKLRDLFSGFSDTEGEALTLIQLGNLYWKLGDLKTSTIRYTQVIDYLNTNKPLLNSDFFYTKILKARTLRVSNYLELKQLDKAKEDVFETESLLSKVKTPLLKINVLKNLAQLNSMLKNHQESLRINREIINIGRLENMPKAVSIGLGNLAGEKAKLGDLDSAAYYLKSALKHDKLNNLTRGIITKQINLGNIFKYQKKYKESEIYLNEAIQMAQKEENSALLMQALSRKAGLLTATNRFNESIEMNKSVIAYLENQERFDMVTLVYENLHQSYLKLGKIDSALYTYKTKIKISDSIAEVERKSKIEALNIKFQTEKKEKENLKLKQETAEKDLNISRKNNIILISSLIFGLILISLITYQLKKFRDKNKALEASIEKRERAEKELETVRDNISKDFHDDLGNRLARITSLSDLILTTSDKRDKENVLSAVKKIKEDSDVLYNGTRDFMFSLKTKSDYTEELFTYLSDFGEEFFQSFDISFFVSKNMDRNTRLPYYWNRQIIMIFKEAMTNIAKHSEAKNVELHINLDKNDLHISLKDDGKGFNMEGLKRKNGLKNMSARALKIDANLHFVSDKNGTSVNFDAYLPE